MSLGPLLMIEMSRRCGHAATGALLRDAGQQAGYCLDAPDEIPAGDVEWHNSDIDCLSGPLERMIPREQSPCGEG